MILTLLMGALVLRTVECHTISEIAPVGPNGLINVKYMFINEAGASDSAEFTYDGKRQSLIVGTSFAIQ